LHAAPEQSPLPLQPHAPPPVTATHAVPTLSPAQLVQAPPEAPHVSAAVPARHVPTPPSSSAQQPLLQSCDEEHASVQR
jgi:hypothetical protein